MAIKKQKKAGGTASKAKKPAVKTASKKHAVVKKPKSASVKKVSPPKAKAAVAPKKKSMTAKTPTKAKPKASAAKVTKKVPSKKTVKPVAKKTGAASTPALKTGNRFSQKDLAKFRIDLLSMRERITGQSGAMRTAALQRNDEVNFDHWKAKTRDRTEAPVSVKLSYSTDGETFTNPEECTIEWGEEEKSDVSREAEIPFPAKARYVRLAFKANPENKRKVMSLDEVWIMGLGE